MKMKTKQNGALVLTLMLIISTLLGGCNNKPSNIVNNSPEEQIAEMGAEVASIAIEALSTTDVSDDNTPVLSFNNYITKDNYEQWVIKSPDESEDRATITYNGETSYVCNCGSTVIKKDKTNLRVAQVTEDEMKQGEEMHSCYLTQPETVNLARRDVEEFINIALNDYKITDEKLELIEKDISEGGKKNIQLYADMLISDIESQYTIDDRITNFYVPDTEGNEYPLHTVWEIHETKDGIQKRLQATYILYGDYHLMIRPVTGYDENTYSVMVSSSETTQLEWLAVDIYTAERIVNAKSEKEVTDIYNANKYVINVNNDTAISEEDAVAYLLGIQNDIVIGAYVPAE